MVRLRVIAARFTDLPPRKVTSLEMAVSLADAADYALWAVGCLHFQGNAQINRF